MTNFRFGISNANMPPLQAMFHNAEQHREVVEAAGADGMELMALRSRLMADVRRGIGAEALKAIIISQHQSYRAHTIPRTVIQAEQLVAMPRLDKSLLTMLRVQDLITHNLPAVVYPMQPYASDDRMSGKVDYHHWASSFSQLRWQPKADVLQRHHLLSQDPNIAISNIREFNRLNNLDAVVFDNQHWTAQHNDLVMPRWQDTLPRLLRSGVCVEMHIGPARTDLGGDTSQLDKILRGEIAQTDIGEMLTCVAENPPAADIFDIILELPHQAIVHGRSWLEVNRDVVAASREIVNSAQ